MIGSKPNFIDSLYFVGEPDNWHLKPGAPKEVIKEFKSFMREYNQMPFENGATLHCVIKALITEKGPLSIHQIADYINKFKLYMRADCQPIKSNQIRARVSKYSHLLIFKDGIVYLNADNKILQIEASIKRHGRNSYWALIDI